MKYYEIFLITNRYKKVASVKGDYRWGWQWVWQEGFQRGRLGQLWRYNEDRQLVNMLGMCLTVYVKQFIFVDGYYTYQDKCRKKDSSQIWDIASNGKIFNPIGCLHSKHNTKRNEEWLIVSPTGCSWDGSSETWELVRCGSVDHRGMYHFPSLCYGRQLREWI